MAYNIFWQIPFRALRSDAIYTVNIYKDGTPGSGYPKTLIGAANPFTTSEDNNDDMFKSMRTQSGYIRFVDSSNSWREIIPDSDIDRPVTLTDENNNILWQGFIQAQNFGVTLYGGTQEIRLPIQCSLSTLSRIDIDASAYNGMKNFAAIIDYALNQIPCIGITSLCFQGGADAMQWLVRKVDWMTFGEFDDEGVYDSKYDVREVLENLCRYWGWSIRTHGTDLHFVAVDDTSLTNFLIVTRSQLTTMAGGTPTGTIDSSGYTSVSIGDVMAGTNNKDSQVRGCNKASIEADADEINEPLVYLYPESVCKEMDAGGYYTDPQTGVSYTNNKGSFDSLFIEGEMMASSVGNSYFNIRRYDDETMPVIHNCVYHTAEAGFCIMKTKRPYILSGGEFKIEFKRYQGAQEDNDSRLWLQVRIRDASSDSRVYWNGTSRTWTSTASYAMVTDGAIIPVTGSLTYGYVEIVVAGWDDQVIADLADFSVTFSLPNTPGSSIFTQERRDSNTYTAKNDRMCYKEWSEDVFFATENYNAFGAALVVNPNNTYFKGWDYANHQEATTLTPKQAGYQPIDLAAPTTPEQHLVNRIAKYWSSSRRKIVCELRSLLIPDITPHYKVSIDGSTMYPIAISREWRDDVTTLTLLEL